MLSYIRHIATSLLAINNFVNISKYLQKKLSGPSHKDFFPSVSNAVCYQLMQNVLGWIIAIQQQYTQPSTVNSINEELNAMRTRCQEVTAEAQNEYDGRDNLIATLWEANAAHKTQPAWPADITKYAFSYDNAMYAWEFTTRQWFTRADAGDEDVKLDDPAATWPLSLALLTGQGLPQYKLGWQYLIHRGELFTGSGAPATEDAADAAAGDAEGTLHGPVFSRPKARALPSSRVPASMHQSSRSNPPVVGGGLPGPGGGAAAGPCNPGMQGKLDLLILRLKAEHKMLSVIMGRGGTQELGCTFWGQTELLCYDDAQHGIWGMSYKYHERAMVLNERNLIRVYDVAFDGYTGGMDQKIYDGWKDEDKRHEFREHTYNRKAPYSGASMIVFALPTEKQSQETLPNPLIFCGCESFEIASPEESSANVTDLMDHDPFDFAGQGNTSKTSLAQQEVYKKLIHHIGITDWSSLSQSSKSAGEMAIANEAEQRVMAFEGTMKTYNSVGTLIEHCMGSGHLGPSYPGIASVREGRGINNTAQPPTMGRLI